MKKREQAGIKCRSLPFSQLTPSNEDLEESG